MKKLLLSLFLTIYFYLPAFSQGPTLNLVGTSPSISKGTINTEILSQIIQEKQEEVKKKVFHNLVVKAFSDTNVNSKFNNFATYHYLYKLMQVVTSGKNKTVITQSITEYSAEFAFIYGLIMYLDMNPDTSLQLGDLNLGISFLDSMKVRYLNETISPPQNIRDFNVLIDLCYDVILRDQAASSPFKFKEKVDADLQFTTWYNTDNNYIQLSRSYRGIADVRSYILRKFREFQSIIIEKERIISKIDSLKSFGNNVLNNNIDGILENIFINNSSTLRGTVNRLRTEYNSTFTSHQRNLARQVDSLLSININFDRFQDLTSFYLGLRKSNFKDFTITKSQYDGLKFILSKFLETVKNQTENNVAANLIEFMLENTIIEYKDNQGFTKNGQNFATNDKGYLYVDIEALINNIDEKYSSISRKGGGIYTQWIFTLGINYASFKENSLLTEGTIAKSLSTLQFASEKIGFKVKLYNWKYINSFPPGETYKYGFFSTNKYKSTPQKKSLFNDVHIMFYGSGLLYNLVNLKSEKSFNYTIIGANFGVTFYNSLTLSAGVGFPIVENDLKYPFVNLAFDIPIIEYLRALKKK